VLRDVFLASIFVAYVEPKFFSAFARENSPVQPLTIEIAEAQKRDQTLKIYYA
jgi:hypothetical protein